MPKEGNQPSFINPDGSLKQPVVAKVAEDSIRAQVKAAEEARKNAERLAALRKQAEDRAKDHGA